MKGYHDWMLELRPIIGTRAAGVVARIMRDLNRTDLDLLKKLTDREILDEPLSGKATLEKIRARFPYTGAVRTPPKKNVARNGTLQYGVPDLIKDGRWLLLVYEDGSGAELYAWYQDTQGRTGWHTADGVYEDGLRPIMMHPTWWCVMPETFSAAIDNRIG